MLMIALFASQERAEGETASGSEEADVPLDTLRERLSAGDAEAFEQVFRCLSEPVFRFVCGMIQDEAVSHDITQDVFAKLWTIRDRMDTVDSLRAYVFQMARNRVYNRQRDERTRRAHKEEVQDVHQTSSPPSPDRELDADLLASVLDEWVGELPDRQREALCLRRQENLSHDEIAEVMDIAPSTVNNHLARALKTLRSRLREYRPDLLS